MPVLQGDLYCVEQWGICQTIFWSRGVRSQGVRSQEMLVEDRKVDHYSLFTPPDFSSEAITQNGRWPHFVLTSSKVLYLGKRTNGL